MYVKVRSMDGTQTAVLSISKIIDIRDFRLLVQEKLNVPPERQRLFYRGKQMEDGHRLFDYNVNVNDVIQMMVKPILNEVTNQSQKKEKKSEKSAITDKESILSSNFDTYKEPMSKYYEVGDLVDAKCLYDNTWWEGQITKIALNVNCKKKTNKDDGLFYYVKFERYHDLPEDELKLEHIRPRARTKIPLKDLNPGQVVMVNYNVENPTERGFWYDFEVKEVVNSTRAKKHLVGSLLISSDNQLTDCHITFLDEVFKIEQSILLTERCSSFSFDSNMPDKRKNGPNCANCKDVPSRKCKECGCAICGGKESPEKQVMCDECDQPYHIFCLDPPLENIPDVDEWFCPECKNDDSEIVRAGEKLKQSKKKAKMASSKNTGNCGRDWGKGFACAARMKVCTIVPQDHFGPIPGVEVGSLWKFRLQVSEAGIHRPHVAGIHGRENKGAYSIVLAGGYEDDEDRGDEFTYTGSGGRDLSGNKRTAEQSCDQVLTRMNRALALNCNTPLNKDGAEAADWRKGKPVRVVRNYKGRKHSDFAPEEGNRYDGIYKIVKYWKACGKSGFKVWRYLLRRDDPTPPPWTPEGQKRIQEFGITMQYPDGYLDAMEAKQESESSKASLSSRDFEEDGEGEADTPKTKRKSGQKRKSLKDPQTNSNDRENSSCKKMKKTIATTYELNEEVRKAIECDETNAKLWTSCKAKIKDGQTQFLRSVEENFACVCCHLLVYEAATTPCKHNVCSSCLRRSFKANVYTCPSCRCDLGKNFEIIANKELHSTLVKLFPGYGNGR